MWLCGDAWMFRMHHRRLMWWTPPPAVAIPPVLSSIARGQAQACTMRQSPPPTREQRTHPSPRCFRNCRCRNPVLATLIGHLSHENHRRIRRYRFVVAGPPAPPGLCHSRVLISRRWGGIRLYRANVAHSGQTEASPLERESTCPKLPTSGPAARSSRASF